VIGLAGRALRRLLFARSGPLTSELSKARAGDAEGLVPARLAPQRVAKSICGYCSTGCSLDVHVRDGQAVNLAPSAAYPVNDGAACPKGWDALAPLRANDRARRPLLRQRRGSRLQPASWDSALDFFVDRMRDVQTRHGAASAAFLGTGQMPTEELALLGGLAKFGMGMVHGDGNTRQCMASAVVAYKQSFGFDAPPYTYKDFEESDVIVLWGSNLCVAHPIMWQRVCRNPHSPHIVVVDPRRTETAARASHHVGLRPKSDLSLIYGIARLLIERDLLDRDCIDQHTAGFDDFAAHVQPFTPERVVEDTGLDQADIERMATAIGTGKRVSLWWTMGVNQSHQGVRTAQGLINLALMTGNIGRPGTGANSITGQCNAMGSRLFANTTSLFGGRDFTSESDRGEVAGILGIDADRIPDQPSWAYDQILEGIARGDIKALWVIATNTAHSWINQRDVAPLLDKLDFLVVQDMYESTETAVLADLVLPAAGWGEKNGTFINSERRIGRLSRAATPPGDALSDYDIFLRIAERWGCADMFEQWSSPEAAFGLLQRLSAGRPCDITGIEGYDELERAGGVQWPKPDGAADLASERRLFEDRRFYHADGRARFLFCDPEPPAEPARGRFPFTLLTGRGSSTQWHTETRTGKSPVLASMSPRDPYVELHPDDATARGIEDGQWVRVETRRASVSARAQVTSCVQPGQLFMAMHYHVTNQLTFPSFDPYSRQPSYKSSAADIRPLRHWENP